MDTSFLSDHYENLCFGSLDSNPHAIGIKFGILCSKNKWIFYASIVLIWIVQGARNYTYCKIGYLYSAVVFITYKNNMRYVWVWKTCGGIYIVTQSVDLQKLLIAFIHSNKNCECMQRNIIVRWYMLPRMWWNTNGCNWRI